VQNPKLHHWIRLHNQGKPKYMHHATFQRLVNEYEEREAEAMGLAMKWLLRSGERMATKCQ